MLEEAQAAYELDRKKRKALGMPVLPFDESFVKPRLNEQQLFAAFKWRLAQNDCQNRGYVLDGYPKTYAEARGVLMRPDTKAGEEEQQQDENAPLVVDSKLMPQSVVHLQAEDEFLFERVRQLPEAQLSGTHNNNDGLKRRLTHYRQINKERTGLVWL